MEHFSRDAQRLITSFESIAFHLGHSLITSEHLLLGILKEKELLFTKELLKYKVDYDIVYKKIKNKYEKKEADPLYMEYSVELKLLLTHADIISKANKEEKVSLNHIIIALLSESTSLGIELLCDLKVKVSDLKKVVIVQKNKNIDLENITDLHPMGRNIKDPLIGRDSEISQLINALSRRNKPNAILVGLPGVGKTAIVEELASRLEKEEVPSLKGKRIYELDIASTVGGTKYRGEFEDKIKKILKKVKESKNIILFVDEIHNIVHAGGAEGAIDASNILKPYLSRGDIQMIGATTEDEFNDFFEKDKPLKRRFQVIKVNPSTKEETKVILKKLKPIYEKYYDNLVDNDVIDYIVEMADAYLNELSFPDKAIDVLDNTLVMCDHKITNNDVDNTFATYYKIENINSSKIDTLCKKLDKDIIGQNKAIQKIKEALSMSKAHFDDGISSSMLFVGPSGVGKSKIAFLIGDTLFSRDNICYLNMSQYQDNYALSKLTSTKSGYNDENGFLKKMKNHPHCLLILDEFEKANIEIVDFFAQILDTGGFYDSSNRYISMKNVMIIMLTNACYENEKIFNKNTSCSNEEIKKKLNNYFRKELLSRIDEIIVFDYLTSVDGINLMHKYLDVNFEMSKELCLNDRELKTYGARYIKKVIRKVYADNLKK